jgi:hypothetical protein
MSEVAPTVEMKLVGSNTFSSPRIDNRRVINKGEIVAVPPDVAAYLEGMTYMDASNNEFPVWIRKGEKVRSKAIARAAAEMDPPENDDEDSAMPRTRRKK